MFTYFNGDFPVNSEFTWLVYRCLPGISTETLGHVAFFTPTGHLDGELAALKRTWICGTPRGAGLIPLIWKLPILGSAGIQGVLWYPGIPLKADNYPAELSDSLSSEMSEMKPVGNDSPDPNHHSSDVTTCHLRCGHDQIHPNLDRKFVGSLGNCWQSVDHVWPIAKRQMIVLGHQPLALKDFHSGAPECQTNAEMEGGQRIWPKRLQCAR